MCSYCMLLGFQEMFYNFNQSFWKPFLATFPRTFTTPFYFQGKDAEILGALDQMQKYQETINGHGKYLIRNFGKQMLFLDAVVSTLMTLHQYRS